MNVFSVQAEEADVELLMRRVRQRLDRWERGGAPASEGEMVGLSLPMSWGSDFRKDLYLLESQWSIAGDAIIHSTRPGVGPVIIAFQRIVRRLTWWFLEPILFQLRTFNMTVVRGIQGLFRRQTMTADQVGELLERVERLERQVREMSEGGTPSTSGDDGGVS